MSITLHELMIHGNGRHNYVYLASPFTQHPGGRDAACRDAARAAGWLADIHGVPVFSPIAHSHTVHMAYGDVCSDSHEFWLSLDEPLVRNAAGIVVLAHTGWAVSYGIREELWMLQDSQGPHEYKQAWLMHPIRDGDKGYLVEPVRAQTLIDIITRNRNEGDYTI